MERAEEQRIESVQKIHHFYCDDCGKYLGSSEEYPDGYYEEIGLLELKFYLSDGWYRKRSILCDECREKFIDSMRKTLTEKGFCAE